jgi:1-acyl-sn-glycerol-3-phosphate acyltransferase
MQKLSAYILKCKGWEIIGEVPKQPKLMVCFAPHTSNWDFFWGKLAASAIGFKMSFLIKEEWVNNKLVGWWFKRNGAIPVKRHKNTSMTDRMAEEFKKHETLNIVISPEGTRRCNPDWKKGFYYIAQKAGVPILPLVLDYKKKQFIILDIFIPTGNEEEDIHQFKSLFKGYQGKYPAQFSTGLE